MRQPGPRKNTRRGEVASRAKVIWRLWLTEPPFDDNFVVYWSVLRCRLVDPIEEAWERVEAEWGSEEAHRRFVGVCMTMDQLPEAGRRYRQVHEHNPTRREEAGRQIERLIAIATQQLADTRTAAPSMAPKRVLQWVAFAIMLGLMGVGTWLLMRS